jgi:hypothetical protein
MPSKIQHERAKRKRGVQRQAARRAAVEEGREKTIELDDGGGLP